MAIVFTQAAAATLTSLQTRVRRILGDTDASVGNQRWSDAEILDALNLELMKMGTELGLKAGSGYALAETTMAYTADSVSVTLPAGPRTQGIYSVEDISGGVNSPTRLHFDGLDTPQNAHGQARWSLLGDALTIRPTPSGAMTLRIRYVREPYILATGTDQHPLPVGNEEVISLGAAIRLGRTDDELPPGLREDYNDQWLRFLASAKRMRGRKMVRNDRRFR